jgi:uncharacterized protein (TIGR03067 family)
VSRLLPTILLLPVAAVAAPKVKDRPPATMPSIVGHIQAGKEVGRDAEPHHQTFTADGSWEYSYGDGATAGGMTYVTDPKQYPPTIDIRRSMSGKPVYRGIYKVDGDTLTLCVRHRDGDRPTKFESSADHPATIWVFKRVPAKD